MIVCVTYIDNGYAQDAAVTAAAAVVGGGVAVSVYL